jgi:hypothetical protein
VFIKRISIWQVMLFVAAVSICLAIREMSQRRDRYLLKAMLRASTEQSYLSEIGTPIVIGICGMGPRDHPDRTTPADYAARDARCRECARYYRAMKEKYLKAASQPWKSVPPDPPAPDA